MVDAEAVGDCVDIVPGDEKTEAKHSRRMERRSHFSKTELIVARVDRRRIQVSTSPVGGLATGPGSVRRLRQKIDRIAPTHSFIQTRFGVGYKLEPEPKS